MLALFPSLGASYCTGFLFILPIFTIVELNVLLLLCISIYSIACSICLIYEIAFLFSFYSLISQNNYHILIVRKYFCSRLYCTKENGLIEWIDKKIDIQNRDTKSINKIDIQNR